MKMITRRSLFGYIAAAATAFRASSWMPLKPVPPMLFVVNATMMSDDERRRCEWDISHFDSSPATPMEQCFISRGRLGAS